jgi:hypothetical protein
LGEKRWQRGKIGSCGDALAQKESITEARCSIRLRSRALVSLGYGCNNARPWRGSPKPSTIHFGYPPLPRNNLTSKVTTGQWPKPASGVVGWKTSNSSVGLSTFASNVSQLLSVTPFALALLPPSLPFWPKAAHGSLQLHPTNQPLPSPPSRSPGLSDAPQPPRRATPRKPATNSGCPARPLPRTLASL